LAKTLHRYREVVFSEGKWYTARNAANEAILNEHFYGDVIVSLTPTKRSETSQPIEKQPTESQSEEPLHDNSPPDPPKATKLSPQVSGRSEVTWRCMQAAG